MTASKEEHVDNLLAPSPPPAGPEQDAASVAAHVAGEAAWAPSVHNTQPWGFIMDPAGLSLYADAARQLPVADPVGREMLISCGAALFTARLALRAAGYIPDAQVLPDMARPLLIARLAWPGRAAPTGHERLLAAQVRSRRAHRGAFDPLPVAPRLLAVLQQCADRYGSVLRVITDEGTRAALAEVVQAAERSLQASSAHARELPRPGRPPQAAPVSTGCLPPPTRPAASGPSPTSPAGTSPAAAAGGCRR